MTDPVVQQTVSCPRCSAIQTITCRQLPDGRLQPDVDVLLAAQGWCRVVPLPGGKATIDLGDGRQGVVQLAARTVTNAVWACGQQHAKELAERRELHVEQHAFFGARANEALAAASHGTPPSGRTPPEHTEITCRRKGCCERLVVHRSHGQGPALLAFISANGWISARETGHLYCSKRCGQLSRLDDSAASESAPITRIADVSYQRRKAQLEGAPPDPPQRGKAAR